MTNASPSRPPGAKAGWRIGHGRISLFATCVTPARDRPRVAPNQSKPASHAVAATFPRRCPQLTATCRTTMGAAASDRRPLACQTRRPSAEPLACHGDGRASSWATRWTSPRLRRPASVGRCGTATSQRAVLWCRWSHGTARNATTRRAAAKRRTESRRLGRSLEARSRRRCSMVISRGWCIPSRDRPAHELLGDRGAHAASGKSNPSTNASARADGGGPGQAAPQSQTQVLSDAL